VAERSIREHLRRLLDWEDAHVGFDAAVAEVPAALRGVRPTGVPYSCWELLEHVRLTQFDILEFCRNPTYSEPSWPADYWPAGAAPPSEQAWSESIASYRSDRDALQRLAAGPGQELLDEIPQGSGQTYLREILLVADHSAYHVGQLVLVRRLLGIWPPEGRAAGGEPG
jgi:hypothetical protein